MAISATRDSSSSHVVQKGGQRDPLNFWDFFDVTGDQRIDLSDTLLILDHFGHGPNDDPLDKLLDRYCPDPAKPWRTAASIDTNGIDFTDALVNLQSYGHYRAAPP